MKAALYSRRSRRSPSIKRSIVSTISFVGTILDYGCRFKMGLPDAYEAAGLQLVQRVTMPANNLLLAFGRKTPALQTR